MPTWIAVTEKLLHEEKKIQEKCDDSSGAVFVSQQRPGKKNFKCYHCDKIGHTKRKCKLYLDSIKNNTSGARAKCAESEDTSTVTLVASAFSCKVNSESWIIDSGASQHMCNDKSSFSVLVNPSKAILVLIGNGKILMATGLGKVPLNLILYDGRTRDCLLDRVLYIPDITQNLLSVSKVAKGGNFTQFCDEDCKIFNENNELLALGSKIGELYYLNCSRRISEKANVGSTMNCNEVIWHRRFCHLGYDNMNKLVTKELVSGIDCQFTRNSYVCEHCCAGKIHRNPFPCGSTKAKRVPLELVHTDLCGKISPQSEGGSYYFLTYTDDFYKFTWVYILKTKDETFAKFKEWHSLVEKQLNRKVKILRTDCGGEYMSNEFKAYQLIQYFDQFSPVKPSSIEVIALARLLSGSMNQLMTSRRCAARFKIGWTASFSHGMINDVDSLVFDPR